MNAAAVRTGELLPPTLSRTGRAKVRLWLPLTPVFLVLAPFALGLAPLLWLAPRRLRPINPYLAAIAIGQILLSMGGTLVEVDTSDALVRIRIF